MTRAQKPKSESFTCVKEEEEGRERGGGKEGEGEEKREERKKRERREGNDNHISYYMTSQ